MILWDTLQQLKLIGKLHCWIRFDSLMSNEACSVRSDLQRPLEIIWKPPVPNQFRLNVDAGFSCAQK